MFQVEHSYIYGAERDLNIVWQSGLNLCHRGIIRIQSPYVQALTRKY